MGLDIRIVPNDRRQQIVEALERSGFDVSMCEKQISMPGDNTNNRTGSVLEITVQQNARKIVLSYIKDDGEFGGYRIYIPNLGAWRRKRNLELAQFQSDVTNVLESVGAYLPIPNDAG